MGGGELGSLVLGVEERVKLSLVFLLTKLPNKSELVGLLAAAKILWRQSLAISSLVLVGGGGCIKGGLNQGNMEATKYKKVSTSKNRPEN